MIAVPVAPISAGRWPERMPGRSAAASPTVLVVDDSPVIRLLIADMLAAAGYGVEVAEDGAEALDKIRRARPDAVLTDLNMPRLDGFGLIVAVRRDPSLADLPILVVTSEENQAKRARALAAGAGAWIVKPFEPAELVEALWEIETPA